MKQIFRARRTFHVRGKMQPVVREFHANNYEKIQSTPIGEAVTIERSIGWFEYAEDITHLNDETEIFDGYITGEERRRIESLAPSEADSFLVTGLKQTPRRSRIGAPDRISVRYYKTQSRFV